MYRFELISNQIILAGMGRGILGRGGRPGFNNQFSEFGNNFNGNGHFGSPNQLTSMERDMLDIIAEGFNQLSTQEERSRGYECNSLGLNSRGEIKSTKDVLVQYKNSCKVITFKSVRQRSDVNAFRAELEKQSIPTSPLQKWNDKFRTYVDVELYELENIEDGTRFRIESVVMDHEKVQQQQANKKKSKKGISHSEGSNNATDAPEGSTQNKNDTREMMKVLQEAFDEVLERADLPNSSNNAGSFQNDERNYRSQNIPPLIDSRESQNRPPLIDTRQSQNMPPLTDTRQANNMPPLVDTREYMNDNSQFSNYPYHSGDFHDRNLPHPNHLPMNFNGCDLRFRQNAMGGPFHPNMYNGPPHPFYNRPFLNRGFPPNRPNFPHPSNVDPRYNMPFRGGRPGFINRMPPPGNMAPPPMEKQIEKPGNKWTWQEILEWEEVEFEFIVCDRSKY